MTPEVILCQLTIEQVVTQIFARHRISSLDRQLLTSPLRSGTEIDEREHTFINLVLDGLQSGLRRKCRGLVASHSIFSHPSSHKGCPYSDAVGRISINN